MPVARTSVAWKPARPSFPPEGESGIREKQKGPVCETGVGSILPIEDIPYSGLKADGIADIDKCFL